jgi:hypothetical protein
MESGERKVGEYEVQKTKLVERLGRLDRPVRKSGPHGLKRKFSVMGKDWISS